MVGNLNRLGLGGYYVNTKNNIHLSYDEYVTLMCLFGAKNIYGTFADSDYSDISAELIQKLWDNCQNTLTDKMYIDIKDNNVSFNMALYYLINECVNSKRVFNIQISGQEGTIMDCTFHAADETIIVCVENDTVNKEVNMFIQSPKHIYKRICSYIGEDANNLGIFANIPIIFTEQEYFSLMANINMNNSEKIQSLLPEGLNDDITSELLYALKSNNKSLVITDYSNSEDDIYVFILGKNLYWSISNSEKNNIEFQTHTYQDIRDILRNYLGLTGEI